MLRQYFISPQLRLLIDSPVEVAPEIIESVGLDVDLVARPAQESDRTAEAVPRPVKILDSDVGCAWIERLDESCFLMELRVVLVCHSFE